MPFLTQGKTNWKFLLIVVVLATVVGGGIWWLQKNMPEPEVITILPQDEFPGIEKLEKSVIFTKYLDDKVQLFELSPQLKNIRLLFVVDVVGKSPQFQVAENGFITYSFSYPTDSIFLWDGSFIKKIYQDDREFRYTLSPDGKSVILAFIEVIKSTAEESILNFKFYKLTIENSELEFLCEATTTAGYDASAMYEFVGWSKKENSKVLLQEFYEGQLHAYFNGLYELDMAEKKIFKRLILEKKKYIASDENYKNLAVTIEDTACCGGLNYSNDQTFIVTLPDGAESKIFDEYLTFHNEKKNWTEQHYTENAYFSPDSKYIVQTIQNVYRESERERNYRNPPTLLVTDFSGKKTYSKEGLEVLGWISPTTLLVRFDVIYVPTSFSFNSFITKSGGMALINVESGEQTNILSGDFSEAWILK